VDTGHGASLPEDVVYASITKNTGRFVSILPGDPCENLLELCAGTGIAALIGASRYARNSWACDLSGRCTHFAEFNRHLNGLENLLALQGDLYQPVEGLKFDRIVAHPPYVPAEEQKLMFRDGGEDGEQILRSIVMGLPDFLIPGGRFYALTLATDREGETLEQRVRKWLGEAHSDFDVHLVYNDAERRPDVLLQAVVDAKGKLGELGPRSKVFERLKVETILYGVIVVERHETARAPLTGRCKKSRNSGSDIVEWFRHWQVSTAAADFASTLMHARPRLAASLILAVTHTVQGGELTPAEFRMRSEQPLNSDARVEPWVAVLVGACDGSRTVRELFGYLKEQEVITAEMSLAEFGGVVKLLIESGFLEIAEFPLPAPQRPSRALSAVAVQ
jgi:tRNA1(Val) A37 N6-methylase TrmN6